MTCFIQGDKVGLRLTISLTQDIGLAGATGMDHSDFEEGLPAIGITWERVIPFFNVFYHWLGELIFGAIVSGTPRQHSYRR